MVFSAVLFVILYVWQNVEVMKIKMDCREASGIEKKLIKQNDLLRYRIERFKRMEIIEKYANENGMKQLEPDDFKTIIINKM